MQIFIIYVHEDIIFLIILQGFLFLLLGPNTFASPSDELLCLYAFSSFPACARAVV